MKIKNLFEEELPYYIDFLNGNNQTLTWERFGGDLSGSPDEFTGRFYAAYHKLESLNGAPKRVFGNFDVSSNLITTLEGAPELVTYDFKCANSPYLVSLKGSPVSTTFFCATGCEKLTSLEGGPKRVSSVFSVDMCALTSLKGSPEYIGARAEFGHNKITNFDGAPHTITGDMIIENNEITSLVGISDNIKTLNGHLDLTGNPITEGGAELLLIDGLQGVLYDDTSPNSNEKIQHFIKLLRRALSKGDKDVWNFQKELIDAGLEEFAQI